jgi:hypothetical protein
MGNAKSKERKVLEMYKQLLDRKIEKEEYWKLK